MAAQQVIKFPNMAQISETIWSEESQTQIKQSIYVIFLNNLKHLKFLNWFLLIKNIASMEDPWFLPETFELFQHYFYI